MHEHPKIKAALAQVDAYHAELRQRAPHAVGIPDYVRSFSLNTNEALVASYDPRAGRRFKALVHVLPSGDVMTSAGISLSVKRKQVQCSRRATKHGPKKLGNIEVMTAEDLARHIKRALSSVLHIAFRGTSEAKPARLSGEAVEVMREALQLRDDLRDLSFVMCALLDIDALGKSKSASARLAMLDKAKANFNAMFGGSLDSALALLHGRPNDAEIAAGRERERAKNIERLRKSVADAESLRLPFGSIYDYATCTDLAESLWWARDTPEVEALWQDFGQAIQDVPTGECSGGLHYEDLQEVEYSEEWPEMRAAYDRHIPRLINSGLAEIRAVLDELGAAPELEPDPFS
ncbi:hypothetical protein CEW88_11585 [Alloyangia pacifica]|uniref:Uncharacterized protein n=1 Tax=Alloyangia pacifica TaxID=311180 RepID=A0A2U8HEE8_9RHOB|nr:hypothetical protein [Alloyangia pacifica]AWI84269.1 hypothetical protein CEW88_11585 [Alloyangia pacifica]